MGGLGNQMFQYAAARALSYRKNTGLKMDISFYDGSQDRYSFRRYGLSCFELPQNFASTKEICRLKGEYANKIQRFIYEYRQRFLPYYCKSHYREQINYDPNFINASKDVYLNGYWQSEKYFKDIEKIIRKDFTIKIAQDSLNKEMAGAILKIESVSIHIRRDDYAPNPIANQKFIACPLEYYYEAIEKLASKVTNPRFFVFSDDPDWVKENLKVSYPVVFVTHNTKSKDYEDLRLMSLCRHHIIANSTFSWWGAWLCENQRKIVIAPKKWFNDKSIDTSDITPETWLRI